MPTASPTPPHGPMNDNTATTWRDLADQLTDACRRGEEERTSLRHIERDARHNAAFDEITAAFADEPGCEVRLGHHGGDAACGQPARYHVVCHECGRGLVCDAHLRSFLRQIDGDVGARCNRCGREFAGIDDAVRITAI